MSTRHPLFPISAVRGIEAAALASLPPHTLMSRAGDAACRLVLARWPGHRVTVLCGRGNNGGDGLVLARLLHQARVPVRLLMLPAGQRALPEEAAWALSSLPPGVLRDGDPATAPHDARALPELIVDALYGIGLRDPMPPVAAAWIAWANGRDAARLALDLPSGLDADTGRVAGSAFVADCTLTFLRDKPGLHTHAGRDHAGEVIVAPLDTEGFAAPATDPPAGVLVRREDCDALFAPRRHDTHKGSFGTLAVLGGGRGMTGAALLASRAGLHLGAGKVFVAFPAGAPDLACDPLQPELMLRTARGLIDEHADAIDAWVMGCGLGTDEGARGALADALQAAGDRAVVIDADGLLLLADQPGLLPARAAAPRVLTPHPREAARLLGVDTAAVQADRIGQARRLAARRDAWVVLKGSGTVISSPAGDWSINASGNAGLATAGTGDVLAGMIGALLAQGLAPADAVPGAVWLHGAAADDLVARGTGPAGLVAGEVFLAARTLRNTARP